MTLRDIIKEKHDIAEKTRFANYLLSGNITADNYASFLYNLYLIYDVLERECLKHHLFDGIEDICRADKIMIDLGELNQIKHYLSPITTKYVDYILELSGIHPNLLLAHVYVRHFGDMFGGQMIKKVVPGSGTMYDFNHKKELIEKTRARLDVSLGSEANVAMQYAIDLFEDLANVLGV